MSAGRWLSFLIVCMVGLVLLSGCVTTLAPARVLLSDGDVAEAAVAVQANGIKHYSWTECSGSGLDAICRLAYQRVLLGATIYRYTFTAAAGAQINHPELAVTDDGRAFVVFTLCFSSCTDYTSVFPADAGNTTPITLDPLAAPDQASAGPPRIESRGNSVYATYLVATDPAPRLRYRQLSGGTSGGYVDVRPEVVPSDPSLAIGGDGRLYVTWKADTVSSREIAYGNNVGTEADFSLIANYDAEGNYSFRNPDIALGPSDTPYIVYDYDDGGSDTIKIRCEAEVSACFAGVSDRTIPLDSAQHPWRLRGHPQIEALSSSPVVVFAADTSATDSDEIWFYTPPSAGLDPGPTRVTANAVPDGEPAIVVERSNFGAVPVVAWRDYAAIGCPRDAYVFYFNSSTTRRVFDAGTGCGNDAQDLDANGPWVAGVWAAPTSDDSSRVVPWTIFNAHTTYAPIISSAP